MQEPYVIRIRATIRFLGFLIAVIIGFPHALGVVYFLVHPADLIANWPGFLMCLFFALIGITAGYRWIGIGAEITDAQVTMRGWLRTTRIARTAFVKVDKVWSTDTHSEHGTRKSYDYLLLNQYGESVGKIPSSVELCPDFNDFLERLRQIASTNRQTIGHEPQRDIRDLPADQWTAEDIQRYEEEN
ncbi:MAG: hypothetical protein HKN47_09785 [Pirellulaceae bacterium]|nr:hypothetical protein [Pirellulaceae bacterium]